MTDKTDETESSGGGDRRQDADRRQFGRGKPDRRESERRGDNPAK